MSSAFQFQASTSQLILWPTVWNMPSARHDV